MSTTVVYYSLNGNSAFIAEKASALTGAAIVHLEPENDIPKKGFSRFLKGGSAAIRQNDVQLKPYEFDDSSDIIILCCPVWASTCPPAVSKFLKQHSLVGKKVYLLASSMSGKTEGITEKLRMLTGDDTIVAVQGFTNPLKSPEESEAILTMFLRGQGLI